MSSATDLLNKLKQLPQAKLSQFVVAVLLIYIAAILANITWTLMPASTSGDGAGLLSPKQQANRSSAKSGGQSFSVNAITSLNLFGDHKAVVKEVAPVVEEVTVAPETSLNLKLSATIAEDLVGKGSAIIESAGEQGTYGNNDQINATTATVHQVFTDRVILQVGNRKETLMLDGVDYNNSDNNTPTNRRDNGGRNARDKAKNSFSSPNPRNDRKIEPSRKRNDAKRKQVDKRKDRALARKLAQQRQNVLDNPTKLMDFIRVSPVRKNGTLSGYRLNPSSDPALFKQAGLRPNDLAIEINGYALNDMQQAMTALQELRQVSEANIVVERDGARTEILFSLGDRSDKSRRNDPDPRANGGKLN